MIHIIENKVFLTTKAWLELLKKENIKFEVILKNDTHCIIYDGRNYFGTNIKELENTITSKNLIKNYKNKILYNRTIFKLAQYYKDRLLQHLK